MSIEYSTQRYTLQALPRDLVAQVEQTWLDLHEPTVRMPSVEYWATMATRHDAMAAAYGQLFDALYTEAGALLAHLVIDARQYHQDQAKQARRDREQAAQARRQQAAIDEKPAERQGGQTRVIGDEVQQLVDGHWVYVGAAVVPKQNAIDEQAGQCQLPLQLSGRSQTCLQALAAGWITTPDLCPRCTRLLMDGVSRVVGSDEPLAWHQAYRDRTATGHAET